MIRYPLRKSIKNKKFVKKKKVKKPTKKKNNNDRGKNVSTIMRLAACKILLKNNNSILYCAANDLEMTSSLLLLCRARWVLPPI